MRALLLNRFFLATLSPLMTLAAKGHLLNAGEMGFETCLAKFRFPMISHPRTLESANDTRSY